MTPWDRFATVARGGQADRVPVGLIVDSPWLPTYAGVDTLDYFLREDLFLKINLDLLTRYPDAAWIPGFWIEYGMAAEPSGYGARVVWHHDRPPSIEQVPGGLDVLADMEPADPYEHGLMPLVVRRYADIEKRLLPEGIEIKMVTARGPFAVANWILGATDFMIGLASEPEKVDRFLGSLTTTIIRFLHAQMEALRAPEGIMVLDDIVGMVSPDMFEQFVRPHFSRIFNEFKGMVRVYHNDTPCMHLVKPMSTLGFDVWNFSHEMDIAKVQEQAPNLVLMGNVPPYSVMAEGTTEQVETWARECIRKTNGGHNLILSAGGGVSPGTPASAIDALIRVANETK